MKVRLAKKILLGRYKNKNIYWITKVVHNSLDWKEDHRVVKALQIYHRKRRRKEVSNE